MTETVEHQIQNLEKLLSSQPRSPLFARLASFYLDTGRTQEALRICDNGLAHHPFYSTGHLIKGKILLALSMPAEARREFEFVHDALPGNESILHTLRDLPSGDIDSLSAPPEADTASPPTTEPEPIAESSPPAPSGEAATPEASAEEVLSQFAETPAEASEETQESKGDSASSGEPSETFAAESATETPSTDLGSAEDAFGLGEESTQSSDTTVTDTFSEAPPLLSEISPETGETEEPFEDFAERKRGELFGLENAITLEEFLAEQPQSDEPAAAPPAREDPFAALVSEEQQAGESSPESPSEGSSPESPSEEDPFAQLSQGLDNAGDQVGTGEAPESDQIQELADKLQNAKKITPVIDLSDKTPVPPSESETPSGSGFVTPTLAEIYAKQGWYDDAIKAYKALAASKPAEKEKFEKRIQELEELKKGEAGG